MNSHLRIHWRRLFFTFVAALVLGQSVHAAPKQRARGALDTGFERKLGVVYKSVGQRELEFDMYYPETGTKQPCPVIVYTHGGGWAAGSRFGASSGSFARLFRQLTRDGFCIVSVDYRLARKGTGVRMRDCVIDSKDAIRYLVKNSNALSIDPKQIFVFGDSAGGHIAQMLLLSPWSSLKGDPELAGVEYRIVAGVSWYGPCDFENIQLFNHDGRPDFKDRFGPRISGGAEVTPDEKRRLYREMSPINYLREDSPPLLMIQSNNNTTIPVHHARHMEKKATAIGAPVETVIVRNAGHNWRKADGQTAISPSVSEIVRRTVAFFHRHEAARKPARNVAGAESRLPEFSWDTLPRYMHARKTAAFTPEELRYLASFPLITFEKTTGSEAYGSTDAGTVQAAAAVKRINPAAKILFYRNVIVHYPGYSFDRELDALRDWSLVDRQGNDKLVRGRVRAYDLTNNRLRKWWTDSAAAVCRDPAIDGLFLDGNVKILTPYLARALPDGKKAAVVERYHQMMRATRRALGPDKLMIANLLRASLDDAGLELMNRFDGSYLEAFEHPVGGVSRRDYLAKGIAAVQQAARRGKIIALTLHIGESGLGDGVDERKANPAKRAAISQERLDYCLALFLIMAERYSYLYIHDGYDMNPARSGGSVSRLWLREFPEYRKPLGPPQGPARRNGYEYTREFQHASVWLDIAAGKGSVTWK